jgi:hypothetical protein
MCEVKGAMPTFLQVSTATVPAIQVGAIRLTPQSRVVKVRLPFGGWVWNRPISVMVEGDAQKRIPIRDMTRLAEILGCLLPLAVWLLARRFLFARKDHVHAGYLR